MLIPSYNRVLDSYDRVVSWAITSYDAGRVLDSYGRVTSYGPITAGFYTITKWW